MSVIQISKIQIRRGKKTVNGIPQLSSAEFAWAVDSQELYIGNGSVAEGAPYVGNTKIITEHDNILDLAAGYMYLESNNAISGTVNRSLQSKLDEHVSVVDFGADGGGIVNNVYAFETALNQLFRNVQLSQRKVLIIPNGIYKFTGDLRIPSNTIIKGETPNGAILALGSHNIRFVSEDGTSGLVNFSSTNRPTNVSISDITVVRTTGSVDITGLSNSRFNNVTLTGTYSFATLPTDPIIDTSKAAVKWLNQIVGTAVSHVDFVNCNFISNGISVYAEQTDSFATYVNFSGCHFLTNYCGIQIAGVESQQNNWNISQTTFEEMYLHAINSDAGTGTIVKDSTFKLCGNELGTAMYPVWPMVSFSGLGNSVIDCSSDRHSSVNILESSTIVAVPEVEYASSVSFTNQQLRLITPMLSGNVCALSINSRYININYVLTLHTVSSETYTRSGKLRLVVGDSKTSVTISDDYLYSPTSTTSTGASMLMNFEFSVVLKDNNEDTVNDTILLLYSNPTTGVSGQMTYDIAYGV